MKKVIRGDVYLAKLYLTELFDLSAVEVTGHFNCRHNSLTSLIGSPHTVDGDFFCEFNQLTNLIGAPHTVGGFFDCRHNPLTSLKGIPKSIEGSFYISEDLKEKFPEEYIRSLSNIEMRVLYW